MKQLIWSKISLDGWPIEKCLKGYQNEEKTI